MLEQFPLEDRLFGAKTDQLTAFTSLITDNLLPWPCFEILFCRLGDESPAELAERDRNSKGKTV